MRYNPLVCMGLLKLGASLGRKKICGATVGRILPLVPLAEWIPVPMAVVVTNLCVAVLLITDFAEFKGASTAFF